MRKEKKKKKKKEVLNGKGKLNYFGNVAYISVMSGCCLCAAVALFFCFCCVFCGFFLRGWGVEEGVWLTSWYGYWFSNLWLVLATQDRVDLNVLRLESSAAP